MPFEAPSGFDDLDSQVEDIARERAAFEQEQALVRQRRAREDEAARRPAMTGDLPYPGDQPRTMRVDDTGTMVPPGMAPAVIDPSGLEYELDSEGAPVKDGKGELIPKGEWERTDDGTVWLDDDGNPAPLWAYDTVELQGRTIQARKPNAAALQAFSMAVSKYTPQRTQNNMIALFVRNHISKRSYAELLQRMMDPDDPFTITSFGDLMAKIATLGSARPTGPSSP
ncbi:hypothetical protein [Nocardia wallacei]|uniref:Uncharacterized protein n=1 Tax=Nocardia wallacei TaxID=480035 RepID=A0A7G1KT13_9NOCA|nr:hypothetical protein [Nocardia wallacei]BCK58388.1 hypothetical protein NWFMUON74_61600 [Nocardia wallacei]